MSEIELVWENEASEAYDDERDASYIVKSTVPRDSSTAWTRLDGDEWYIIGGSNSKETAIERAKLHQSEYPEAPIRVLRVLFQ